MSESQNYFDELNRKIVACERCPRLRAWCQDVALVKRKAYLDEDYWGLPVPNFGDPSATRLIVGLAPAAHGANRTGRQFTGDRSGDWLYRAMHRAGLANQPHATSRDDGLVLQDVIVTPAVHCAPPDNKPTPEEIANCSDYLHSIVNSRKWKAILCLGNIGWTQFHKSMGLPIAKFGHGVSYMHGSTEIFGSYHPSQQNTFTGRLTETMLDEVMQRFATSGC